MKLTAIFDTMSDAIYVADRNGRYTFLNKAAKELFHHAEIRKLGDIAGIAKYYDFEGREITLERSPVNRVLKGEHVHAERMRMVYGDTTRYISVSGTPMYDEAGSIEYAVISGREITDLVEKENTIRKQKDQLLKTEIENSLKDRLLTDITHAIRRPIASMVSLVELLEEEKEHYWDSNREIIDAVREQVKNTYNLVEKLLEWLKSREERLNYNPRVCDILPAAEEELKQQFDELSHHQGMLRKLAYNDSVTGLPNRLWLEERITEIIRSVPFYSALLFIDLDNLKNINDSFGHFFGDTVLTEIGKILKEVIGEEAIVARLGGDEFAVVYSGVQNIVQVKEYAHMLLDRLDTNFREKEIGIHLSASIGVAIYPDHGKSFEELLKNADTAMYKAKNHGKNRYALFDPSMNVELYSKIEMESNLRAAAEHSEFLLNYQPLYCLETRKICGFEALIRWNSAVYGMVSPLKFIPLAEETGLILEMVTGCCGRHADS